jgi:hypothetical protein
LVFALNVLLLLRLQAERLHIINRAKDMVRTAMSFAPPPKSLAPVPDGGSLYSSPTD